MRSLRARLDAPAHFRRREGTPLGRRSLAEISAPLAAGAKKSVQLATQVLAISIPRNFTVDIAIKGDELKKEDLTKIKSQFNRWIEGLEEAFEE